MSPSVVYEPYLEVGVCSCVCNDSPPIMTCGLPRLTSHNAKRKATCSSECYWILDYSLAQAVNNYNAGYLEGYIGDLAESTPSKITTSPLTA